MNKNETARTEILEESFTLSLRSKYWKYVMPFYGTTPDWLANKTAIENGINKSPQLFDIDKNPTEKINLAQKFPEIVKQMQQRINLLKVYQIKPSTLNLVL